MGALADGIADQAVDSDGGENESEDRETAQYPAKKFVAAILAVKQRGHGHYVGHGEVGIEARNGGPQS